MKAKHLAFVVALASSTMTLWAQTEPGTDQPFPVPPPPPPPPSAAPAYGYYGYNNYGPGPVLAGAVTSPYAFNWRASGISAELGALWQGGSFLGGEVTYYGGEPVRYDVYNGATYIGSFHSSLELTTVDLAYRYFVPLWNMGPRAKVMFYIGASGGVAFVNYSNDGSFFGFHNYDNGNWTGEGIAGLQFDVGPRIALRVGYRYVDVSHTWKFNRRVNLESSVVEAGVAFSF